MPVLQLRKLRTERLHSAPKITCSQAVAPGFEPRLVYAETIIFPLVLEIQPNEAGS
jgi:hypothetical protein